MIARIIRILGLGLFGVGLTSSWRLALRRQVSVITGAFLSSQCGSTISIAAEQGAAPKMEFFQVEGDNSKGSPLYTGNEQQMLKDKITSIESSFKTMMSKVEMAVASTQRKEAQTVVANFMGQLKADMRMLSKALSGGDIYQRGSEVGISGTKEAKFDYSTGQFALSPIAASAERVIGAINDLYFNDLPSSDGEAVTKELAKIQTLFDEFILSAKR